MANTFYEEFKVTGSELLGRVKELVNEGNIRRIIIQNSRGKKILEVPLTIGLAGAGGMIFLAPFISAVALLAVVLSSAKIIVERYENEAGDEHEVRADYIEIDDEEEVKRKKESRKPD